MYSSNSQTATSDTDAPRSLRYWPGRTPELVRDGELSALELRLVDALQQRGRYPSPAVLLHTRTTDPGELGLPVDGERDPWSVRKVQRHLKELHRVHPATGRPILSEYSEGGRKWLRVELPYAFDPKARETYVPRVELNRRRAAERAAQQASLEADLDHRRATAPPPPQPPAGHARSTRPEPGARTPEERAAAAELARAREAQAVGHCPEGRQVVEEVAAQVAPDHGCELQRAVIGSRLEGGAVVLVTSTALQARHLGTLYGELFREAGAAMGRAVRVVNRLSVLLVCGLLAGLLATGQGAAGFHGVVEGPAPEPQRIGLAPQQGGQGARLVDVQGGLELLEQPHGQGQRVAAVLPAGHGRRSGPEHVGELLLGELGAAPDAAHHLGQAQVDALSGHGPSPGRGPRGCTGPPGIPPPAG